MTRSPQPSSDTASTVRLSGARGMVAAVPQMLGFQPHESVVLMCLRVPPGPADPSRRRDVSGGSAGRHQLTIGPIMRGDLFDEPQPEILDQFRNLAQSHADAVVVVAYHDDPCRPRCVDLVTAALERHDIPLIAVLSVHDGRIRDASGPAAYRTDPGVDIPDDDDPGVRALAAARALSGRQVLGSRAAVRASIAGPGETAAAFLTAPLAAASRTIDEWGDDPHAVSEKVAALVATCRDEFDTGGRLGTESLAHLIVLSSNPDRRDIVIAHTINDDRQRMLPLLISAAACCPDSEAAGLCSVLAVTAYRHGDGALAQCAAERVLAVDPDHRLTLLLLSIMAAALPPDVLADLGNEAARHGVPLEMHRNARPAG